MLRYEMADQIEDELSGSDDGDLSSDDESEVRADETEREDDSDAGSHPPRAGDNSEENKDG